MTPIGWNPVLSMRLHWITSALALLLFVAPTALADEADLGLEPSKILGDLQGGQAQGQGGEPPAQVEPKRLERAVDQAQREVETKRAAAEARLWVLADQAGLLIDEVLHEAESITGEAERQVPDVKQTLYGPDVAPEPEAEPAVAPKAQLIESIDFTEPMLLVGATATAAGVLFWLAGSTGMTGAGQVAGASTSELRRLLPYASPMFTRFERDTVLGHPKREALYAQIMQKPGVTLQDLCEKTGLSRTAVSHHLRLLEQQHLIVSKRMGRSRHFFENGGRYGRDQKDAYAVLHNDRSKDIHSFIQGNPGAIQKDLCEAMEIQASVAHWHVKRLEEARLIEAVRQGRTVSYFPTQALSYA